MGDREPRHQRRHLTQRAREKDQRHHEGQVVPAGKDVLDAEHEVARQRCSWGRRAPFRSCRLNLPARGGLGQHALENGAVGQCHPRKVEVRRKHVEKKPTLKSEVAVRGADHAPRIHGPAIRRDPRAGRARGGTHFPAHEHAYMLCYVASQRGRRPASRAGAKRQSG